MIGFANCVCVWELLGLGFILVFGGDGGGLSVD